MQKNNYQNPYERFVKAKPSQPCPICGKGDWCGFNSYLVSCMRVEEGSFKTVQLNNGQVAYLHGIDTKSINTPVIQEEEVLQPVQVAPVEVRDRVYREFLKLLHLYPRHKDDLIRRGLSESDVEISEYKSIPEQEKPWTICRRLINKGYDLAGIPGFYKANGPYETYWTFNKQAGYFIPVLDQKGCIQALQRRMDNPDCGGKYKLFSGYKSKGGCSCGTPAHVARPDKLKDHRVWITEGPLKADIASKYLGTLVVGALSATAWKPVVEKVLKLKTKEVVLAYDMDLVTNLEVARAEKILKSELKMHGLKVYRATWKTGKGIDDALVAGMEIKEVSENEDCFRD